MKTLADRIFKTKLKYFIGAGLLIILSMMYMGFESAVISVETSEVKSGEFIIDIVSVGEIAAHQSKVIQAPMNIRGSLQIVEMVAEGSDVNEGDFLVKFDTASLETQLITKEDDLLNLLQQREEKVASQEAAMVQKDAQLQIQGYNHEQAKIRYELMKFEPEIKQKQQQIDMMKADLELNKAREDITQQKLMDTNELRRHDEKIKRKRKEISDLNAQVTSANISSPGKGIVIYRKSYSGGEETKIKIGDNVHRRQDILEIPDLSVMLVETSINEVEISKIRRGQEVVITLDANENTYYGTVSDISRLARSEYGATTIKVFDVQVTIKNSDATLKPGMSATCTIVTDKVDNVVFVPLKSVIEEEGETYVYVADNGDYKKTKVVAKQKNTDFIIIEEGLEAGQFVTLRDPNSKLLEIGKEIKDKPSSTRAKAISSQSSQRGTSDMMRMMRGRH